MIGSTAHDGPHLRWPADRFYWAILDAASMPGRPTGRSRRQHERLGYLFESVLPGVTIEEVQAVYQRLPGNTKRVLACGVTRKVLEQEVDQCALTLSPRTAPTFVDERIEPAALNLLTGRFLPGAVRRAHRRLILSIGLVLTLCAVLVIVGLARRTSAQRRAHDDIFTARTAILEQVLGSAAPAPGMGAGIPGAGLPGAGAELRMTAERRRLEQTRSDDVAVSQPYDSARVLARLLALWPSDVPAQTQSLSISSTSIMLRAQVPSMADAQRLADALASFPKWQLHQPQSESRRDHVQVTLRLGRNQEQDR
ncbi:MAG: hypothetical protein V3T84_01415 [Phycisphaerales bacterium]